MSSIHRYLDEAFAGIELTPDIQDLKEELRGSLSARADELEAGGQDAATAAATAVKELGDIRALIASLDPVPAAEIHRVRPNPTFVVVSVILSLLIAASATGIALVAVHIVDIPWWASPAVLGIAVGALVDYALRQETSQHYRMPSARAAGFGLSALAMGLGLGLGGAFVGEGSPGILIAAIVLVVVAIASFTWFGVTQTNRAKPWVLEQTRAYEADSRFAQDPVAAARFGIYTVVIMILGGAAFVVLSITVGFAWSWLAVVAAFAVFFLVLARMLFSGKESEK